MQPGSRFAPKPEWLKVRAPGGDTYHALKQTFRQLDLHTVCEEARCPNVGECWREGTATVMLLGETCTRGCRFCAVTTGDPRGFVDVREPEHTARAIARLGLQYVVLTMVNRDDLLDGGAEHVARTVARLRELRPDIVVEALVGDFMGRMGDVDVLAEGGPHVFAHNVEVVRRLTRSVRDVRASYDQSLRVLEHARTHVGKGKVRLTKSSIMVGIGETDDEVEETLRDLRAVGVDVVTIGQYLRPTPKHKEVDRYVPPETFVAYERKALELGFKHAASAPLARSSYRAAEVFLRSLVASADDVAGGDVEGELARRLEAAKQAAAVLDAEFGESSSAAPVWYGKAPAADAAAGGLIPVGSLVRRA